MSLKKEYNPQDLSGFMDLFMKLWQKGKTWLFSKQTFARHMTLWIMMCFFIFSKVWMPPSSNLCCWEGALRICNLAAKYWWIQEGRQQRISPKLNWCQTRMPDLPPFVCNCVWHPPGEFEEGIQPPRPIRLYGWLGDGASESWNHQFSYSNLQEIWKSNWS